MSTSLTLNFHGVGLKVEVRRSEVLEQFRHDFRYFLSPKPPRISLTLKELGRRPRWKLLRKVGRAELFASPVGGRRVCYHGKAFVEYLPRSGTAAFYGATPEQAYEAALAVVLSAAGEGLDLRGRHRVHGLGLEAGGRGALFLAASGTGKSTLALELLRLTPCGIYSDDTPLVDRSGRMSAFPQRIAVRERPKGVPDRHIRRFRRLAYGEKYVVGAAAFAHRVPASVPVDRIVLMKRRGATEPRAREVGRWALAWPLAKWLVAGYETPQMWELFLRGGWQELRDKARILLSRVGAAGSLLWKARALELELGTDGEANARFVFDALLQGEGA